jgi:hypothetical protein
MRAAWEQIVHDRLQLYGHRNWLVIADSAYPAQSRPGIETILANEEQTSLLARLFAMLRQCRHVKPNIFLDQELRFVAEQDAPGVSSYRKELRRLLKGYELGTLPHDEIISKLDVAGDHFQVLIVKSNMRIPYTSVFLELECGYWDTHAERCLRSAMSSIDGKPGNRDFVNCTSNVGQARESRVSR